MTVLLRAREFLENYPTFIAKAIALPIPLSITLRGCLKSKKALIGIVCQ